MSLQDQVDLTHDNAFAQRVFMAAVQAAKDIVGEDWGDGTHPAYHEKRNTLGQAVLNAGGDNNVRSRFLWAVAASPAITAAATDSDIQFTVAQVWDDIAGVLNSERP